MSNSPNHEQLFELCRDYVAREEGHLRSTLATLRQIRQELAGGNVETLTRAFQEALRATELVNAITEQRDQFRRQVGTMLKTNPNALTLGAIANFLAPTEAAFVHDSRRRLRELALQVEQLNHGNALVVWWCLDFVRQVFSHLAGQPVRSRYSATGKVQRVSCGPTWQGQG